MTDSVPDVVDLCRRLIALDSQNPPGRETPVAGLVDEVLTAAGFAVRWHAAQPDRPNVVGTLSRGPGRRLILQAHADTKPAVAAGAVDRWTHDAFRATEVDGRLYGLGACDTKGGLAAQLVAACALAADQHWRGELVVQAVADEEDGSRLGAEHLLALGLLDADAAVVAEPTGCLPSLAQLGLAWAEIEVTGRAAHAGTPGEGLDAFRAASAYVAEVDRLVAGLGTAAEFPGHPRLNVGYFALPGHPGTMPGECRLRCDIRVLPGVRLDDVFALYEEAAVTVRRSVGASIAVRPYQGGGRPSHFVEAGHPLAERFRAVQRETDQPVATMPFLGGTDARYFAGAGTPAIVYGPGSLRQAHAPDEYVPLAELTLAARQLTRLAAGYLA
ncbi:M20 family metallopeptidase [Plantactinospora sp. KBS50]|uniref:M20 family metallopeptidase n=1 Tax=Plantactinospora sp. KBS50 TaxID=2024580 RepID=UPI0012FE64C2|nr:M20/M25/M40 family metallo-hydrolase [Plantactinospora sp. KBS50]